MISKLEKIVGMGKKVVHSLSYAGALLGSMYLGDKLAGDANGQDINEGKVVVSLKCVDEQGNEPINRKIKPNEKYQLQIIGDNRGINTKTVEIDWFGVSIPYLAGLTDIPQPNPKYEKDDFFRQENPDEKFVMHPLINFVSLNDNYRSTKEINTPEGFIKTGPTNRIGVLGIYNFITPQESLGRKLYFSIGFVRAYGKSIQPVKFTKSLSIVVVNDPINDVGLAFERDYANNELKIEVLEAVGKTSVLEYTTNLTNGNWIPIKTNDFSGQIFKVTDSIDSSKPAKFYRSRVSQ